MDKKSRWVGGIRVLGHFWDAHLVGWVFTSPSGTHNTFRALSIWLICLYREEKLSYHFLQWKMFHTTLNHPYFILYKSTMEAGTSESAEERLNTFYIENAFILYYLVSSFKSNRNLDNIFEKQKKSFHGGSQGKMCLWNVSIGIPRACRCVAFSVLLI